MNALQDLIATQRAEQAELVALADERDCPSTIAVQVAEQRRTLRQRVTLRAPKIERLLAPLNEHELLALFSS